MYYDEKVIDGVVYFRTTPNGEWVRMTEDQLTKAYIQKSQDSRLMYAKIAYLHDKLEEAIEHVPFSIAKKMTSDIEDDLKYLVEIKDELEDE